MRTSDIQPHKRGRNVSCCLRYHLYEWTCEGNSEKSRSYPAILIMGPNAEISSGISVSAGAANFINVPVRY